MASKNLQRGLGPKSKTHKKIDNNIRLGLNDVCEQYFKDIRGFIWLTHQVNYTNFPASLLITCVFASEREKLEALEQGIKAQMEKQIQVRLLKAGVKFIAIGRQVVLDSQEACDNQNMGSWAARLAGTQAVAVPKNRPS